MSFQTPITIADTIHNIDREFYLLPAIQREFVWDTNQIEWLFDSLMRGYPISSFLFWSVESGARSDYKFYRFLKEYRQFYKIHNTEANTDGRDNFFAILDGQQRLTSLYLGLKGSYAYKEPRMWVKDDERNIPTRRLYLNLSRLLEDQEDDRSYEFSFLKDADTQRADIYEQNTHRWFRVGKILDLREIEDFIQFTQDVALVKLEVSALSKLQSVIHTKPIINFYLEKGSDFQKALNIFIRINSGGAPLAFSDLIMSIAVANWKRKNAREEIHHLVDQIQLLGFSITKDFIFKSYLYLFNSDIRFKVTNFTKDNALNFEQEWGNIRDAIQVTFELIRSYGYTDYTLASKNAAIPILYYIYHRSIYRDFLKSVNHREDRAVIQKWLHVLLLKRVLGTGGGDGTLAQMRRGFVDDITLGPKIAPDITTFPASAINTQIKQDLSIGQEFVEELLKTQKDDRYAFGILALLYPDLDYRNNDFHKDHLHPISFFTQKAQDQSGLSEEDKNTFLSPEWNNSIVNLQMLDGNENKSKQDKTLKAWVDLETASRDRDSFLKKCLIPVAQSLELKNFVNFSRARQTLLTEKLKALLS